ncbi:L-seryl-tRNA(Sec) selenium transferase [Geothermobacter hydrogeniphilus]|uniref:L-seryl-tRNA(Sec) selenium transferase n=1 Tax=Geothermobacter hydrogeniphilus TaxID=1969733 RepID=A0A1X0YBJ9_9BACT|nr:L-seryl-tRNA(Sec) selenium transferase [Geothermobacter hydrogeniphilus]ORJ62482.1 L-seryl-tRNA(Sec) selenium transferase [Geothermobacter hydrogeniphilus]
MRNKQTLLRNLPAVDKLLQSAPFLDLAADIPHALQLEACQATVECLRREILGRPEAFTAADLDIDSVAQRAAEQARQLHRPNLRPVINATGTLLHTNLGRAPLSDAALQAVERVSRGYSNLEFDLDNGGRGHRYSHVEDLLCKLTGAEAATVVNNNAGAVLLALTALAKGREAIVSRGELVEIGGAFRIPEVMAAGGVQLREVGATNKTHLRDYRAAIGEQTGLLLKVHTSNYRIVGFSEAVPAADLVGLAAEHGLPVLEDLGSGMLIDLTEYGLPHEPTVAETVAAGVDLVTFSGDKLLGGPQAGLIVGRREAIDKIRRHPMARAMRIDKMTLAALEATLRPYLDRERALREIPVLRMLAESAGNLRRRCRKLAATLKKTCGGHVTVEILAEVSRVGGGALPLTELPGWALALSLPDGSVEALAARLRQGEPPLVGRIQNDQLLLNPRTVLPEEEPLLCRCLAAALNAPDH